MLSVPGSGIKLGTSGGLQLGSLNNQGMSSNDGNKPILLSGQQSSSSSVQFGVSSCQYGILRKYGIILHVVGQAFKYCH